MILPLVSLENVVLRFAEQTVLHDVTLTIPRGEHPAFLGANGSGKSSLLRLLSGELWPSPGSGHRIYSFDGTEQIVSPILARRRIRRVSPEMQERFFTVGFTAYRL